MNNKKGDENLTRKLLKIFLLNVMLIGVLMTTNKSVDAIEVFDWISVIDSPRVSRVTSSSSIVFNPEAVNLSGLGIGLGSEVMAYDKNGDLLRTHPIPSPNHPGNYLFFGEKIRVTKVGIYNNRYVDIVLENITDKGAEINRGPTYRVFPTGRIQFTLGQLGTTLDDSEMDFLNMTIIDHATGEVHNDTPFYLEINTLAGGTLSLGDSIYTLDKNTYSYYLNARSASAAEMNKQLYIDANSSNVFDFITQSGTMEGLPWPYIGGELTIYGTTGSSGYKIGSAGTKNGPIYYLFDYNSQGIGLPLNYTPLTIPSEAHEIELSNGTQVGLTMVQRLESQLERNIPVNDSFELVINESNTGYLDIKPEDFKLVLNGKAIEKDASKYSILVKKENDAHIISIKLTTNYLKQINKADGTSNVLEIQQISNVINNEEAVKKSIGEGFPLVMPTTASLTYQMLNGDSSIVSRGVDTPNLDISLLTLTPSLTADSLENHQVLKGSRVGDIPLSEIIENPRNTSFPWDVVTAVPTNPELILDTVGKQKISLTLTSTTFETSQVMDVIVDVRDVFTLTYDANGAAGTPPDSIDFTSEGVTIADATKLTKNGFEFVGWGLKPNLAENEIRYQPGDSFGLKPEELQDTTLYALWDIDLTVSWLEKEIVTKKETTVDRSLPIMEWPYYWMTSAKTSYLVNVILGEDIIATETITNEEETQSMTGEWLYIPTADMKYGENQLTVEFIWLDEAGEPVTNEPKATLQLTVTVEGSLQLVNAPASLNWTNRTLSNVQGILARDADNRMTIGVLDSREESLKGEWYVQATTTMLNPNEEIPFELVWKQTETSTVESIQDSGIRVLDSQSIMPEAYTYLNTWNPREGVLLDTKDTLRIGDYSGKMMVEWTLYDVMQP